MYFSVIPAHVGIESNEKLDQLSKEARLLNDNRNYYTYLFDVNVPAELKLGKPPINKRFQIRELKIRVITKTIIG